MVTLVAAIAERLIARGETVAVIESGAGGRVADLLTDRPGASAWFAGGIVAYSNASKRDVARVDSRLLDAAGAVSLDVARALALGARDRFGATWGLGETGIAGPQGGRRSTKAAGLTYLAVAGPGGIAWCGELSTGIDDRSANKQEFALALLRRFLDLLDGSSG